MDSSTFLTYSLLYYFLPKLALFLPLCWMAAVFWWADKQDDGQGQDASSELSAEASKSPLSSGWYEGVVGGRDGGRLPGDWL